MRILTGSAWFFGDFEKWKFNVFCMFSSFLLQSQKLDQKWCFWSERTSGAWLSGRNRYERYHYHRFSIHEESFYNMFLILLMDLMDFIGLMDIIDLMNFIDLMNIIDFFILILIYFQCLPTSCRTPQLWLLFTSQILTYFQCLPTSSKYLLYPINLYTPSHG